jgi:hypothetical protein
MIYQSSPHIKSDHGLKSATVTTIKSAVKSGIFPSTKSDWRLLAPHDPIRSESEINVDRTLQTMHATHSYSPIWPRAVSIYAAAKARL